MSSSFTKYQKTIDNLSLIARSAILVISLSIIFTVWYYGFWQDLYHSMTTTSDKIKTLKLSVSTLETQLETLEARAKAALNFETKNGTKTSSLYQTKTILHNLLTTTNDLISFHSTSVSPKEINTHIAKDRVNIVIRFLGDYFSTMHYLQTIEKLHWRIVWDKLEYKVIQYPMAEVTLYLHMINNYGDWINA